LWLIAIDYTPLIGLNDQPQTTNHKQQTSCVTNNKPQKLQPKEEIPFIFVASQQL